MADLEEVRDGAITVLTLNRPDRLNAFSDEMLRALIDALQRLGTDSETGAIVLTGAGRAFSAGGDVKAMGSRDVTFEERVQGLRWKQAVPQMIRGCPRPVVAAINGPAMGAGFVTAAACDFRIAADTARFGASFVNVGFSGDFGGAYLLSKLVGPMKAREIYLLGDTFGAAEAQAMGLLTKIVPPDALMAEALALAGRLAKGPRVAYAYIKANMLLAETATLAEVAEREAVHQARTAQTEDHAEAKRAFVEKRTPLFQGR